jgi:hypothetical protein
VIGDVHATLDHFGREEYVAFGWSGGALGRTSEL